MNRSDSSRRETIVILVIWSVVCIWVMLSSHFLGYVDDTSDVKILFGMPSWVTWSIALPWLVSSTISLWFALGFMKDEATEEEV